jgi:hypothetical protein
MSGVDLSTRECDGDAVVELRAELDLAAAAGVAAAVIRMFERLCWAAKVRWSVTAYVDSRHPEGVR